MIADRSPAVLIDPSQLGSSSLPIRNTIHRLANTEVWLLLLYARNVTASLSAHSLKAIRAAI